MVAGIQTSDSLLFLSSDKVFAGVHGELLIRAQLSQQY